MMLDCVPRTHIAVAGRPRSAFLVCGWTGYGVAAGVALGLTAAQGLRVADQVAVVLAAIAVFVAVATGARRVLGRDALVYYHHILTFLACAAMLALLLGAPVLPHLDATAVGLAAFTAIARVGCLMVGCCHGRPGRWGVVYGPAHARLGLPGYLVGVRLIPVQAVEAATAAVLAAGGGALVLGGAAPGGALALFLGGYAVVRYGLEWLRGDLLRPQARGLSEPQWTSLAVAGAVAAGAATGLLPGGAFAAAPVAALAVAAAAGVAGRAPGRRALLAPVQVRELSRRLARLPASSSAAVPTARTSGGVRVSVGETSPHVHYTVSADGRRLTADEATGMARLLLWLRHPRGQALLVAGAAGAVHVVLAPPEGDPGSAQTELVGTAHPE